VKRLLKLELVQMPAPAPMEGFGVRPDVTQDDEFDVTLAADELAETKPQ
jgi:hypothetical protein